YSSDGDSKYDQGHGLALAELEREAIVRALEITGGNKSRAARLLGISRATLYEKLREIKGEPG
ncbi:MAG: helix-turn-helix domain-containing protein, partial [Desulfotomaculales bacterium]